MSFLNALIWILVFYTIYYLVVFVYDAVVEKTVKETTGVEDFIVERPNDKVVTVVATNHEDYMPKHDVQDAKVIQLPTSDDADNSGSSFVAEKKKLTTDIPTVKEVIKADFDVNGQPLQIEDFTDQVMRFMQEAVDENSPMRQQMNNIYY
jgi:hypothetical protein